MSYDPLLTERKARTTAERCIGWSRCGNLRRGLDLTCSPCRGRFQKYGAVDGQPVFMRDWLPYRRQVARIFKANQAHPAVTSAVHYLSDLMARAAVPDQADQDGAFSSAFKGSRELARLHREGIEPTVILETVCAVALYLDRSPMRTRREELYAISRAVCYLAARPVRTSMSAGKITIYRRIPRPSDLLAIGTLLVTELALVMALAKQGVEASEAADKAAIEAIRSPLVVPPTRRCRGGPKTSHCRPATAVA